MTFRNFSPIERLGPQDLLVLVKGYVATDHVVEEDPERPNRCRLGPVIVVPDPLWRTVQSRAYIIKGGSCLKYQSVM